MPSPESKIQLKQINWVLIGLIILINGYILLLPLLPKLDYWVKKQQAETTQGLPYQTSVDSSNNDKRQPIPEDKRLVIPKIALNEPIIEGQSEYSVNNGVWARPKTSVPPKGSNTVLVGHRFTYGGPATFYSLDKVSIGDKLVIYWDKKEYIYTVKDTKVVPASAVEVENPTNEPTLTVYTCTPIWSAKDRLVVVASLDKEPQ